MQAPAGSTFRTVLAWTSAAGFAIALIGLIVGIIPPPKHALADSSHIVSLYFDGQKKVITTGAGTVGEALDEAGVQLGAGDTVEPAATQKLPTGFFNINVYRSRPVMVVDGDVRKTIQTSSQSPDLIAKAAGLTVYPEDTYSVSTISEVAEAGVVGQEVVIHRSVPLTIQADGRQYQVRTQQKTVGGLLSERDVALAPQDTTEPGTATPVVAGMTIHINRVAVVVLTENQAIARETKTLKDANLEAGTTKVQTEGSDGQKAMTYRIHYKNGVEQSREQLSSKVITEPVTKVVVQGTKIVYSSDPVKLGQQMAAVRGWTGSQWTALYQLWQKESNWNPNARNAWSGACGIPQANPCSKIPDRSTAGQITWGLNYIAGKYGTPANAWAYWQRNHSY